MVSKGSSFADFMRFRQYTYARTQQSLPPLRGAIKFHSTISSRIKFQNDHMFQHNGFVNVEKKYLGTFLSEK